MFGLLDLVDIHAPHLLHLPLLPPCDGEASPSENP